MRLLIASFIFLIVSAASADDLFVASTFNLGILRLISVESSGEMSVVTNEPISSEAFDVSTDPFGRFTACFDNGHVYVHRVGSNDTLERTDVFQREDYFYSHSLAVSPDGRIVVVKAGELNGAITSSELEAMAPEDNRFFIKTFFVNNRLQLVETGFELPRPLDGDLIHAFTMDISPIGSSTILLSLPTAQDVSFAALHLLPTGEIVDEGVRLGDGLAYNSRISLSSDGRYAVASKDWSALIRIEDDRTLTMADFLPFPTWAPRNPQFTPDTHLMIGVGEYVRSGSINPGLVFGSSIGEVETPAGESMAVSQNGSYVLVDHQIIGPGAFQIANIRINPDGTLSDTGFALEFGGKHADIVAIPEQTPPSLPGDANDDGTVDAADLVFLINEAMPDDKPILYPQNFANADLDNDIDVDQDDLNALISLLLTQPL